MVRGKAAWEKWISRGDGDDRNAQYVYGLVLDRDPEWEHMADIRRRVGSDSQRVKSTECQGRKQTRGRSAVR